MLLTQEALQARLIALHRASLELIQDVSLETLLKRIVRLAREQVEAEYAALGVLNQEGHLEAFITAGMDEAQIAAIPHPPVGKGLIGVLMHARRPLRLDDLQKHPQSSGFPKGHPPMRSFLGVPIRLGQHQLGQIYLTNQRITGHFSADDEMLVEMLANYAAVAIHNARLYERLSERDRILTQRNADLNLLNDMASALTSSLEMEEILNKTLAMIMNYLKIDAGEIFLLDEDEKTLRMVLHRGQAAQAFWSRKRFALGEGLVGKAAQERRAIVSADLASEHGFLRREVVKAGFRKIACLPLIASDNLLVGVLGVARRSDEDLSAHDIQLLTAVSNWAGLAIENAQLHTNERRLAILEERERIGMDLHDGVIQDLYGIGLGLDNTIHMLDNASTETIQAELRKAIDGLNDAIRDLRAYILDLRPHQLGQGSLHDGLKKLITEYRAHTLSEASLNVAAEDLLNLAPEKAKGLFRICQEALANAAKHAEARRVDVNIWQTDSRIMLEVRDNGKGFDQDHIQSNIGHGLSNMMRRAHALGGELEIASARGEGTSILVWLPKN